MAANAQFAMAIHVLTMLAHSRDSVIKSDCIAASVNTNPVVVRRLLGQLNQSGLVVTQTGASGGARLNIDPSDLRLDMIYRAVSCGEPFALHSRGPNPDCPIGRNVGNLLCELQKRIDGAIDRSLADLTLADFLAAADGDCSADAIRGTQSK